MSGKRPRGPRPEARGPAPARTRPDLRLPTQGFLPPGASPRPAFSAPPRGPTAPSSSQPATPRSPYPNVPGSVPPPGFGPRSGGDQPGLRGTTPRPTTPRSPHPKLTPGPTGDARFLYPAPSPPVTPSARNAPVQPGPIRTPSASSLPGTPTSLNQPRFFPTQHPTAEWMFSAHQPGAPGFPPVQQPRTPGFSPAQQPGASGESFPVALPAGSSTGATAKRRIGSRGDGARVETAPLAALSLEPADEHFNIPKRKGKGGTRGRPIKITANHLLVNINLTHVFKYEVEFTSNIWKYGPRRADLPKLYRGFEAFKKKYKKQFPKEFAVAFDGNKMAVSTATKLDLGPEEEFCGSVEFQEFEDVKGQMMTLNVRIKLQDMLDISGSLQNFCQEGSTATRPLDAIQMINNVLVNWSRLTKISVGKSVFDPNQKGRVIGEDGKVFWTGIFSSFRPAWKPFLVVDMSNKPAYEQQDTIDFMAKIVKKTRDRFVKDNLRTFDLKKMEDAISQLKVRYNRPDGQKRDYRVNERLGPKGNQQNGVDHDGKRMTVEEYFSLAYKYKLKFPNLPCLHVGSPKANMFIPMELTEIKKQECPVKKKLSDKETAEMIRFTALPPADRLRNIKDQVGKLKDFENDLFAKEFGISVSDQFLVFCARVLDPPKLGYAGGDVQVRDGKWKMEMPVPVKFTSGATLDFWAIINCDPNLGKDVIASFAKSLSSEAKKCGFQFKSAPSVKDFVQWDNAEAEFVRLAKLLITKGQCTKLIFVITPDKSCPIRACIKFQGDVLLSVPSQFVLSKNVFQPKDSLIHNLLLKMNSKLGGTNQVLANTSRPKILGQPVMLLGADVTHPSPDTPADKRISVAAMVASMDPNASKYYGEIRLQSQKDNKGEKEKGDNRAIEVILETEEMVRNLLLKFYQNSGSKYKPRSIIYYRDGVSEGQFQTVLNKELSAIRRACASFGEDYKPAVTVLVAQKRHHTRLFPTNPKDGVGKMQNVPPGTVVDTEIVNPTEESFYLASHEGIQGTTRPTLYHMLWDENDFDSDQIQELTFFLTHLYSRCERSVSLPAPTYYAHLLAFRARDYLAAFNERPNADMEDFKDRLKQLPMINFFI